jgi:hypothetical protein
VRRRSAAFAVAGSVALFACARPLDPVAADVRWAVERTVPPGGRLAVSSSLRRTHETARASWEVETATGWDAYARGVATRLDGYRMVERGPNSLRFSRPLDGDFYVIALVGKEGPNGLTVAATFEARPF